MHALDVVGHGAFFSDLIDEALNLRSFATDFHFHGAVGHVANRSNDVEPFGKILAGIAESDTLDPAFENNPTSAHEVRMIPGVALRRVQLTGLPPSIQVQDW